MSVAAGDKPPRVARPFGPVVVQVGQEALELPPQPILLAGVPPLCIGPVMVRNPRDVRVQVKQLTFRTQALPLLSSGVRSASASSAAAPNGMANLTARFRGKLQPAATQELFAELTIPMGTPPGTYPAQITCADGVDRPVVVQVLEHRSTRFHPAAQQRTVAPGEKVQLQLSATNVGNVATTIATGVPVLYHAADRDWMDHFHGAARETSEQGFPAFSDAFVARMGRDEPPIGRVRIVTGAGELMPQESRLLELELLVPDALPADRRFLASFELGDGELDLQLTTTAAATPSPQ